MVRVSSNNRHTGKVGPGTLSLGPGTHYAGPGTHHAGPGTLDEKYILQTKFFFNSDPRTSI